MVYFFPAALLLAMGWLIKYRKWTWLIAGYNTASKAERERYDVEKLSRHMGDFLFVLAGVSFLIAVASSLLRERADTIVSLGTAVFVFTVVAGIVYLNTGNRVKKE